jgi:hypothetical protein
MTDKSAIPGSALPAGGTLEIVRVPAGEEKYTISQNPDELAHFICCRDLVWRAVCGYEESEQSIIPEVTDATTICTMCVEVVGGLGGALASRQCPFDDQPCPDDETIDRMIAERVSRG